jgi:hypothetical protein
VAGLGPFRHQGASQRTSDRLKLDVAGHIVTLDAMHCKNHNSRAKSKQDAVLALLNRPQGAPLRRSSRRPAGSLIRCAAFWLAWCARSSG